MELLEKHFDTAFAAPDGINKLRELILTLAMQGKLVPQDPKDQPAVELLKEIEKEKKQLVKNGKIRTSQPLPAIKPEEIPYELPIRWEWVRLNDYGIWKSGSTPNRSNSTYYEGGIPWVKSGEVKQGRINSTDETITLHALNSCSLSLNPIGSVLIAMYGANIGDVGLLEIEAATNQAVCACKVHSGISNIFLRQLLISLKQNFISQGAGAAQPNISREKIIHTIVPLPPISEQHRIVAKIDELMVRCDELEKLRAEREHKRLTVHTAAINNLLIAQEKDSYTDAWQFINRHFSELYLVKENVTELRKAILQLGVMGKLVPQDPDDPPADKLLDEVETEKRKLVKADKIKKTKPLTKIKAEEIPYTLPKGWNWVRFFTVNTVRSELVSAKDFPRENQIAPDSIEKNNGRLLQHRTVAESGATGPNNKFYKGQILYSKIRPSLNKAVVAPYDGLCSADMYPIVCHVYPLFMLKIILSEQFLMQVRLAENRVKMPKLNLESLSQFIIPIPPLSEQHRIVAKIDQLMTLCDNLERQIDATTNKHTELLNAVTAQA